MSVEVVQSKGQIHVTNSAELASFRDLSRSDKHPTSGPSESRLKRSLQPEINATCARKLKPQKGRVDVSSQLLKW